MVPNICPDCSSVMKWEQGMYKCEVCGAVKKINRVQAKEKEESIELEEQRAKR